MVEIQAATESEQIQQLLRYVITKLHRQLQAWHAYYSAVSGSFFLTERFLRFS